MSDAVSAKVVVERTYRASIEDVWDLWTTKDGFESWWGPEGFRVEVETLEARPGGELRYAMIADAEEAILAMKRAGQPTSHPTRSRFVVVEANARIVLENQIDFVRGIAPFESRIEVDFVVDGAWVTMRVTLDALPTPELTRMQSEGFASQTKKLSRRFPEVRPRKLVVQMQVTLDGFDAAGPNDEQGWVTWDLEGIRPHVLAVLDAADTILIGRKLAVDYIPHWEGVARAPEDPMHDFATRISAAKKVVFTRTLDAAPWPRTELARGEIAAEVAALKALPGKDIVAYGGSSFVGALLRAGLVDELVLFVNPIAIGRGWSAFSALESWQPLALLRAVPLESGVVLLHYRRA